MTNRTTALLAVFLFCVVSPVCALSELVRVRRHGNEPQSYEFSYGQEFLPHPAA